MRKIKCPTLVLLLILISSVPGHSSPIDVGHTGLALSFPLSVRYANEREFYGTAGVIIGWPTPFMGGDGNKGLLLETSLGQHDQGFSIGLADASAGWVVGPVSGGALKATLLIPREDNADYFMRENERAVGFEMSLSLMFGINVGVFRTTDTHVTKFIAGFGFGL